MDSERLSQKKDLTCLAPWTFEMFELNQIIFGLHQTNIALQTTVFKANRKADLLPIRTDDFEHSLESVTSHVHLEQLSLLAPMEITSSAY